MSRKQFLEARRAYLIHLRDDLGYSSDSMVRAVNVSGPEHVENILVDASGPDPLPCGHDPGTHPNYQNHCEGAAERDGRVCALGWPRG